MITSKQCYTTSDGQTFSTIEEAKRHEKKYEIKRILNLHFDSTPSPDLLVDIILNKKDALINVLSVDIDNVLPVANDEVKKAIDELFESSPKSLSISSPVIHTIEEFDQMVSKMKHDKETISNARIVLVGYLSSAKWMLSDIMDRFDNGYDGPVCDLVRKFVKRCGDRINKRRAAPNGESRSFYLLPEISKQKQSVDPEKFNEDLTKLIVDLVTESGYKGYRHKALMGRVIGIMENKNPQYTKEFVVDSCKKCADDMAKGGKIERFEISDGPYKGKWAYRMPNCNSK